MHSRSREANCSMEGVYLPQGTPEEIVVKLEPTGSEDEKPTTSTAVETLSTIMEKSLMDEILNLDSTDAIPHPDSMLHRCLHCLEDLQQLDLQGHMIKVHAYRNIGFKCHVCAQTFRIRDDLSAHRRIKHAQPQATCEICFMQFGRKYLARHIQNVHCTLESTEKCVICNKIFKSAQTLKDHIRTVHMQSDEPVNCERCNQEFKSRKYLVNHIRNVHPKGDKVHKCVACAKEFKSRMCLHQHIKNVHPPESASSQCALCPKVFKTKANLSQHMKHVHPELGKVKKRSVKNKPASLLNETVTDYDATATNEMSDVNESFSTEHSSFEKIGNNLFAPHSLTHEYASIPRSVVQENMSHTLNESFLTASLNEPVHNLSHILSMNESFSNSHRSGISDTLTSTQRSMIESFLSSPRSSMNDSLDSSQRSGMNDSFITSDRHLMHDSFASSRSMNESLNLSHGYNPSLLGTGFSQNYYQNISCPMPSTSVLHSSTVSPGDRVI